MLETAKVLQNALHKLGDYRQNWKLKVNTTKTTIIIFNKGGHRISKFSFKTEDKYIDIVNDYCYLGIIFTPSGSFRPAIEALNDKALKAFHKIRNHLYDI